MDYPSVPKHKSGLPKRYVGKLSDATASERKRHWEKTEKMSPSNPKAYEPAPGDKTSKTKESKYTKKYKELYGEDMDIQEEITALRKKADASGVSYSTLKKVYDRGMAAWKTGHRPGTTPQQWALARVNSYLTKGKTYHTTDKDLREEEMDKEDKVVAGIKGSESGDRYEMHTHNKGKDGEWSKIIITHQNGKSTKNEWGGYPTLRTGKTSYIKKHFDSIKEDVNEEIKGWKNAARDISAMRSKQGKGFKMVRLKNDGKESKLSDATTLHNTEDEAVERHERMKSLNPGKKIRHNLYVDNKLVRSLGEEVEQIDEMKTVTNRSKASLMKVNVGGKDHSYKKYGFGLYHPAFGPLKDEKYKSKEEMKVAMEKHPTYNSSMREEVAANAVGSGKVAGLGVGPQGEPGGKAAIISKALKMIKRKKPNA